MTRHRFNWHYRLGLLAALAALAGGAQATELVYTPVNPSFGGNPLNGSYLLNNAIAQDRHKDPDISGGTSLSALERFTSQLESRLLSQVLANVNDGSSGTLSTDQFIVNIVDDSGTLTVQITDRATGEISEISVSGFNSP
jgi:curli production assembly/transport component CsgF